MKNSTSSVQEVLASTTPKANRNKTNKPIANSLLVDQLLRDYSDLIAPSYTKWFAKRFYTIPFDAIHKCASEARADGENPQRLFAFLIKKLSVIHNPIA